jgi:predicted small secreted protein
MKSNMLRPSVSAGAVRAIVLVCGVGAVLALSACNTVRGVAKDVTEVANAFDPDSGK